MNDRIALLALLFTLAPLPVFAEDASDEETEAPSTKKDAGEFTAVADRPTFSAAPWTVPGGHAQFEVGGEFATTDGASQLSFPVLARVGVTEGFELRAGLPSLIVPFSEDTPSDLGSLQLAAKVAGEVNESLSLGALPYLDIAANAEQGTAFSESTYGFALLWAFGFSDAFGIGGNLGAAVGPGSTDEAGPRELFYSASLTASAGFGDLGVTAEGFTVLGQYADATVGGSLSVGYALADKLVLDVYGGSSVQSELATVFAGVGVTFAR